MLIVLLIVGVVLWATAVLWMLRNAKGTTVLSSSMVYPLSSRPFVSIMIPARNEGEIIGASLGRFLAQDYENYEVILVDDASTDGTSEITEEIRKKHPDRLRVIRVDDLPPGWVGKNHALHRAFQSARGEWVLATDADILFHPKALMAGLWTAEQQNAELVSIFSYVQCVSFWEKFLMPGFVMMLSTFFPFRKINDSSSSVAVASGGYILMRRALWQELGGYESIRSEMIDDLNTARIVKHSGHRIFAAITKDLLSTRMYQDFREIWEGLRKNAFAGNRYSMTRILFAIALISLTNTLPLVLFIYSVVHLIPSIVTSPSVAHLNAIFLLSGCQLLLSALVHFPYVTYLGLGVQYALTAPLASILYGFISLDSMIRTVFGAGVSWKLRQYRRPEEEAGR